MTNRGDDAGRPRRGHVPWRGPAGRHAHDIYDRPANTFVAGFIGSPAMNLVRGDIAGGVFRAPGMAVTGLREDVKGPVTLGFRAEDARVAETGQISAPVYTMELLGEATMLAVRVAPTSPPSRLLRISGSASATRPTLLSRRRLPPLRSRHGSEDRLNLPCRLVSRHGCGTPATEQETGMPNEKVTSLQVAELAGSASPR